jgi:hypothetical protein
LARPVQHEAGGGQFQFGRDAVALEIAVEEILDAPVGGAAIAPQQAPVLAVVAQQVVGDVQPVVGVAAPAGLIESRQLQVDLADVAQPLGRDGAARGTAGAGEIVFHGISFRRLLRTLFSHQTGSRDTRRYLDRPRH